MPEPAATVTPPAVTLPKGGGAIRGIGEKFAAAPASGAGSTSVPIAVSPGRGGFAPALTLSYDSTSGNGPFGLGWSLGLPAVTRKTDKGLPRYDGTDVFLLSGVDDLVPVDTDPAPPRVVAGTAYDIVGFRPRIEGLFARIERWTSVTDPAEVFWRSIARDNVTTWYGRTAESRIADPADPRRVLSWLISASHDDLGNVIAYGYQRETGDPDETAGPGRRGRGWQAGRCLKWIRYGNHTPYLPVLGPALEWPALPGENEWFFELVLDYGDGDPVRPDPFSVYRGGFEVRDYRLCRRLRMVHHFPDRPEIGAGCLVRSTDLGYAHDAGPADPRSPVHAKLTSVTQRSYQRDGDGYRVRSRPPVEFGYTEATVRDDLCDVTAENLPAGLHGMRWADLDGDGLPGILAERDGGWFYQRNLSPVSPRARFGAARPVTVPGGAGTQLLDLAGDGRPDVVSFGGPAPGFHTRDEDGWTPHVPFRSLPVVDWADPQLRFADLDGDGLADLLVTEPDAVTWYPSLGTGGFGPGQRSPGPGLVFADGEGSVHLADMSGDGLPDLVRIRDGEITYRPALGFGRFGAPVTMDAAPRFDHAGRFDPGRLRLADVDGSGTVDVIYLHPRGARVWFNRSGNAWSAPVVLTALPPVDDHTDVQVLDLLGNGTACLVWSSSLPGDARRPLRYLDLVGETKPHLLVSVRNNLGARTEIRYAPSTRFALLDEAAGTPWVTRLPFPVHVVERVTQRDKWRDTTFTSTYSYHHGYFDGVEREFHGFGRVEQTDVEDFGAFGAANAGSPYVTADGRLSQPPVRTVTWYHTGGPHDLSAEHRAGGSLPAPDLGPATLTAEERREARRACRGALLHQEVYELDPAALSAVRLLTTTAQSYRVRMLQPRGDRRHAVFHLVPDETLTSHHDQDLRSGAEPDPRVGRTVALHVDEIGTVLQSVTVGYPRRGSATPGTALPDGAAALVAAVQGETHLAYVEARCTSDAPAHPDRHRLRLVCETLTYELTGIDPDRLGDHRLSDRYPGGATAVAGIGYHLLPDRVTPQKRLVAHTRARFFDDAVTGALPLGELSARALPYETYQLAVTAGLLEAVLGDRVTPEVAAALADPRTGGYLLDGEGRYWSRSGTAGYEPGADQHFFRPERFTDAFGAVTTVEYDPRDLFVLAGTDPAGNRTEVLEFDFRVLAPAEVRDPNGVRTQVRFDVLGQPVVTAISGGGAGERLDGFTGAELDRTAAALVTADHDPAVVAALLGAATSRHLYHFGEDERDGVTVWERWAPAAAGLTRERHERQSPVQVAFEYFDGTGNLLVAKRQADPELPGGPLRWIATGATIVNNKGRPVRQYQPYFAPAEVGHRFGDPVRAGVSSVVFYDAVGRPVRTESPDGGVERVDFTPWRVLTYDANDTVLDPGNAWYERMRATVAGERAAAHAGTPSVAVLDSLGRTAVVIDHNRTAGTDRRHVTFTRLDAETRPLWVQDARGNRIVQHVTPPLPGGPVRYDDPQNLAPHGCSPGYDMAGQILVRHGTDDGGRWMLHDAAGRLLFCWNSRGFRSRMTYDVLRRPLGVYVTAAGASTLTGAPREPGLPPGPEALVEYRVYGEMSTDPGAGLRCRVWQVYDGAGVTVSAAYDIEGNLLRSERRFARELRGVPDWSALAGLTDPGRLAAAAAPLLEPGPALSTVSAYDAMRRPTSVTRPDGSVSRASFGAAGLLDRLEVRLGATVTALVTGIGYDALGRRLRVSYGNGCSTAYEYDPLSLRLTRLRTLRPAGPDSTASMLYASPAVVQDLRYSYDAVGNVIRVENTALATTVRAGATGDYVYDALYRLVAARGREHAGQTGPGPDGGSARDHPFAGARIHPNDLQGLRDYVERYEYDDAGNLTRLVHHAGSDPGLPGPVVWQWQHEYAADGNRLLSTTSPGGPPVTYGYDVHGNTVAMAHLPVLRWNYRDQLCASSRQVVTDGTPETTFYAYDMAGARVWKATDRATGAVRNERRYLGDYEIYREFGGAGLERVTVHLNDDEQRVAVAETQTGGGSRLRFQVGDHVTSSCVELDEAGAVISHEEYHPYGTSAFQAGRTATEVSTRRYRYTGKERDEETGFGYHGARYYAPWLARWVSCDPAGLVDGPNLYRYTAGSPVQHHDPTGTQQQMTCAIDPEHPSAVICTPVPARKPDDEIDEVVVHGTKRQPAKPADSKDAETADLGDEDDGEVVDPPVNWEDVKQSGIVQGLGGFLLGVGAANIPIVGPLLGPAGVKTGVLDQPSGDFQWGYGLGQAVAGTVQLIQGFAMMGGGGGGTVGGAVAAPFSGGATLAVSAVGVGAMVAGAAVATQGVANATAGMLLMKNAKTGSGGGGGGGGGGTGPGSWRLHGRSGQGLETQSMFSGKPVVYRNGKAFIEEYELDGVWFDRFKDGVLGEVKDNYSYPISIGSRQAARSLEKQATRQVAVAQKYGLRLEWHVRASDVKAFQFLLRKFPGITIVPFGP